MNGMKIAKLHSMMEDILDNLSDPDTRDTQWREYGRLVRECGCSSCIPPVERGTRHTGLTGEDIAEGRTEFGR